MDFELANILGPVGVLLRARLYDPDGATVTDLALTGVSGVYGGTVTLSPTLDDSEDPYTYEVREVSAQTTGGFNASTSVIIAPDVYGYPTNGEWSEFSGGEPPEGQTSFGTSAGMQQKCNGSYNLETYEFQPVRGLTREDTVSQTQIAASIADDLEEANADMAAAWAEFTTDVPLGYLETYELRWLNDTAEYGAVCKAWAGRNISKGQTEDVPQHIATAMNEWERRLEMLRTGNALKAYFADESATNDTGILELQEGLGPVAAFPCPPLCVDVSNSDCDCTCG